MRDSLLGILEALKAMLRKYEWSSYETYLLAVNIARWIDVS
jgi:hypothetical protein